MRYPVPGRYQVCWRHQGNTEIRQQQSYTRYIVDGAVATSQGKCSNTWTWSAQATKLVPQTFSHWTQQKYTRYKATKSSRFGLPFFYAFVVVFNFCLFALFLDWHSRCTLSAGKDNIKKKNKNNAYYWCTYKYINYCCMYCRRFWLAGQGEEKLEESDALCIAVSVTPWQKQRQRQRKEQAERSEPQSESRWRGKEAGQGSKVWCTMV